MLKKKATKKIHEVEPTLSCSQDHVLKEVILKLREEAVEKDKIIAALERNLQRVANTVRD